jgi:Putative porin
MQYRPWADSRALMTAAVVFLTLFLATNGFCAGGTNDPLIDLLLKKGVISQDEATQVEAEAAAMNTNQAIQYPAPSKWKINDAINNIELFGDIRLRYEHRQADTPANERLGLERGRYALRLGLRGDVLDNFYYGLRLDTSSNPRSPWDTFGTSSSGIPYNGPFGKSTGGINLGQIYLGWRPWNWMDFTVGKMPMPLYTTAMVWDTDFNPEGAAEKFHLTVGQADLFATFAQFLYQDFNPAYASPGLGFNGLLGQSGNSIYQIDYQGGINWHITTNMSAKVAGTIYTYIGLAGMGDPNGTSPYFNGPFVGEGSYLGPGTGTINGFSGYGTSSSLPSISSLGFPLNQVGLNHLMILEVPFEFNLRVNPVDVRLFGDVAYNFEGRQRAQDAAAAYSFYLANNASTIQPFSPQTDDTHAYQFGIAVASTNALGLVYGSTCYKHAWELRSYWQHVEQYALDPNLLDSDFFEGRGNLQGIYVAAAYGLAQNFIGTVRYGNANIINKALGTGGSNQDIPQVNPIEHYNLLQLDLTMRF